jgi:hypothetical protein
VNEENDVSVLLNDMMDMGNQDDEIEFRMSKINFNPERRAPRESMAVQADFRQ